MKLSSKTSSDSPNSESHSSDSKFSQASLWSSFSPSVFSIFETYHESSSSSTIKKKAFNNRSSGWATAMKRVVTGGSMRRIKECMLGTSKTGISSSTSDIWLLGVCYKISVEESSRDASTSNGLAEFEQDFSSRILMTYRKGFEAIGNSKLTSDVNWGCMLRSSQMLVAQALLVHHLGRSWRKTSHMAMEQNYIEILHLFGDTKSSAFSIHNILQAGEAYGLAAGSWIGPYATCRSWETLAHSKREETNPGNQLLPMAVYIISGEEYGERGGAPVVYIEKASRHCLEYSEGQVAWTPILLLVPLVLGLEKINPRYVPSLAATFTFPQSLGILGGKPGASTYIIGVQNENAFYLDPHEAQSVVNISRDDLEADTSSYHCNVIRHISLDSIDPSLAIGFYCRDKDDFDDFCRRASTLADESNGAPLFTVAHTHSLPKAAGYNNTMDSCSELQEDDFNVVTEKDEEDYDHEDDWQLL